MTTVTVHNIHATSSAVSSSGPECNKKYAKIQEGIESSISLDGKAKISRILCEIKNLSDVEKLLLYLKLPTGVPQDEHLRLTPPSCLNTANRKEQSEAFTWIRSHLEEHGDVCMPKAEVFDEYRQYCENHELRPLCNADFGKMMKQVFPDINTRRLGQRGQSKYFYGGLRKKTDHAPPTLSELEIHSKTLEMDTNSLDNEIFKASCLLICEWADKLLDSKFSSIQSIAEHLVTNLYVNTKSVAAFSLIAAMQENGSHNLKGSALFNTQPSTGGDRHKETNLLLQQKLQKNKLLQKQKEKLQAMKEEVELQHGGQTQLTQERKTPSTPSRKSTTPSRMSKTPKLPSPSPSPVLLQSPAKLQSKTEPTSTTQQTFSKPAASIPTMQQAQTGSGKSQVLPRMHQQSLCQTGSSEVVHRSKGENANMKTEKKEIQSMPANRKDFHSVFTFEGYTGKTVEKDGNVENTPENVKADSDVEMGESASPGGKGQDMTTEAETPYSEMETNQNSASHVRKINFDDVFDQQTVTVTCASAVNNQESGSNKGKADGGSDSEKNLSESENLSKSDGHISLKMLLERKDGDKRNLNKSLGVIEKSKNTLFVNQSKVPGRSAFVPFSQVQNRKENTGNQTASSSIPVFIPSSTMNQSTSVAMIAVPSSAVSGSQDLDQSVSRVPDSIIKILPSTAAFQFKHGSMDSVQQNVVIQSQSSVSMATESHFLESSISCLTKDTQTFVTSSSVLSKSSSCDSIVSLSPSIASSTSCVAKHARTRFTPIRPKASPNKAPPSKENKGDNPAYDKRPVSEILKEKRAKEQAEALARFQVGMRMPAIPMQAIGRNNLGQLTSMPNTVSPKDVVIIVNNQAGGANVQTVMAPGMFVTQSLVPSDGQNQSIEGIRKVQIHSGQSGENIEKEQSMSEMAASGVVSGENVTSANKDNIEHYHDTMVVDKEFPGEKEVINTGADADKESEHLDKVDLMWTETPAKIAKLNITSPYRPDSACSLGRDTPVKIMKASDSCSSRPESACSFGRETPSGARKRKSSDISQRRDFKRLNSTGDEGEDILGLKLHNDALSPENEARLNQNVRRTRSCTYELDKDTRVSCSVLLTEGLQSPDITSLEREALLESGFPHSIYSTNKVQKQTSSIGVSAKSLRHSQQKLIKNKPDLDQRVRNFLQKDDNICLPVQNTGNGSSFKPERPSTSIDNLVTKDSVSDHKKTGEFGHVSGGILRRSRFGAVNKKLDIEPSGLPSDVADWINDTIEKRQLQNTSVMSEPDLSTLSQKANPVAELSIADFKFEVGRPVSKNNENLSLASAHNKGSKQIEKSEESTFMVPKAPALHIRGKDGNTRTGPDFHGKSPRCQSLPSFSSPNQSPVPTVTSPISRQGLFRATSMSPRTPQHDNVQGEVCSITSPVQRMDIRDNHPLALSVHAGSKFKEDLSVKKHTRHGSYEEGRSMSSQMGSYLASMQHTLQKPGDIPADQHSQKPREHVTENLSNMTSPQSFSQVAVSKSPFGREVVVSADRNLPQIQERYVSQTPFSDSGYHSNGQSPVNQNSTPVSGLMDLEIGNQQFPAKPSNDSTDFMGVMPQQSPLQSPNQYPGRNTEMECQTVWIHDQAPHFVGPDQDPNCLHRSSTVSNPQGMTVVMPSEVLATSTNSAFVPIQGSTQDARYVTPIKPTVTLPNTGNLDSGSAYSTNIFVEPNPTDLPEEAMIVSPKSHDPPSYETAIKSLRKACNVPAMSNEGLIGNLSTGFQNTNLGTTPVSMFQDTQDVQSEVTSKEVGSQERVSLLANMGKAVETDGKQGTYGPFASKLVQLSRQTQQKPFVQQQQPPPSQQQKSVSVESIGIKPSALLIKQMSHSAVMSAGLEPKGLLKTTETHSSADIPTSLGCDPHGALSNSSMKLPVTYGNWSQSNTSVSSELLHSDGAISSSVQYKNPMDLHLISPTHYLTSSSEHLFKTTPSLTLANHSIQNISQQQSEFTQYAGVSQNEANSAIENQVLLNFGTDNTEHPALQDSRLEHFNIGDEGIKNLPGPKDLCSTDNEFADISLTLETLKELDSQYLSETNEMYERGIESVQPLDDFPMFED